MSAYAGTARGVAALSCVAAGALSISLMLRTLAVSSRADGARRVTLAAEEVGSDAGHREMQPTDSSYARGLDVRDTRFARGELLLIPSPRADALWPLSRSDRERLAREDGVQLRGSGVRELVTAPIKDRDGWEIVGAVGVIVHPWSGSAPVVAAVLFLSLLAAFPASSGVARVARRDGVGGRLLLLSGWLALVLGAALCLGWERRHLSPPLLPTPLVLLHVFLLAAGAAGLLVASWLAAPGRRASEVRDTLTAWGFLSPSLAHLLLFSVGPVLFALYLSMHRWDLLLPSKPFVGLANYRELLADPLFWNALRNTTVYALSVPVTMVLALGSALVLDQPLRGIRLLRTVVFMPYVASFVAIAIVWQWMFNFDFGLLNFALRTLRLPAVDWLGNPRTALLAVMTVNVWVQLGYQMVIFLAGLQGIPESLYEAARLDGARGWQRFRYITVPMLRPVSTYVFLTGVIWSFHAFTLVYVMTEGGPVHATDVIVYQIYQSAFEFRRMGYASAMSWVLFVLLLALTVLQWRLLNRRVEYA